MRILKQGAEAKIYLDRLDGQDVLVKERPPKRYRLRQIDDELRKERTRQEAKLMREARGHGILTPKIIFTEEASCKIFMENIDGEPVKKTLDRTKSAARTCRKIGEEVGRMHSFGIVHGDLTTSNMILKDGEIYFIDFGLGKFSRRIEDMATDLNVFLEALAATHTRVSGACWRSFKSGYASRNASAKQVFDRTEKIQTRARYAKGRIRFKRLQPK